MLGAKAWATTHGSILRDPEGKERFDLLMKVLAVENQTVFQPLAELAYLTSRPESQMPRRHCQ